MRRVEVEYVGGPADGRREPVPVGPNGQPATWRAVPIPAVWASMLDARPIAPASVHRYEREPAVTDAGPVWRYHHRGPFG